MATASENQPYAGDVVLVLGDETITLRCCAEAALRLSRQPGALIDWDNLGADTVYRRVRRMHVDTMAEVIRAGFLRADGEVGAPPNADKALPTKLYAYGLGRLSAELGDWIIYLSNGGRPMVTEATDDKETAADRPLGATETT